MRHFAAFALVMLFAAVGSADPASDALFREARQKYDTGDYLGALDGFTEVYARSRSPGALLNIGTTLKELGRFAAAADAYEAYLADPGANPAKRAATEDALRAVLTRVATLRIDAEPGARVTVDAHDVARTTIRVDVGAHVIVADDGKGEPVAAQVTAAAGEEQLVQLRRRAERDMVDAPLAAQRSSPPTPSHKHASAAAYAIGGAGIAALGLGTYFGLHALSKHSEFSSNPSQATADDGRRAAWFADAGIGVGIVALGAATYLLATDASEVTDRAIAFGPAITLRGANLTARATW